MDLFSQHIHLAYGNIQLQKIDTDLQAELNHLAQDDAIWQTFATNEVNQKGVRASYAFSALDDFLQKKRYPLVVIQNGKAVGCSSFYKYDEKNKSVHLGYTWFIPIIWGTKVNATAKYLLLQFAFETLQVMRVEFTVDSKNQRSQAAMLKLGAIQEGILRQSIIRADGTLRDTVVFSILTDEWPGVKEKLLERIK